MRHSGPAVSKFVFVVAGSEWLTAGMLLARKPRASLNDQR
jgi:hypothetical protein